MPTTSRRPWACGCSGRRHEPRRGPRGGRGRWRGCADARPASGPGVAEPRRRAGDDRRLALRRGRRPRPGRPPDPLGPGPGADPIAGRRAGRAGRDPDRPDARRALRRPARRPRGRRVAGAAAARAHPRSERRTGRAGRAVGPHEGSCAATRPVGARHGTPGRAGRPFGGDRRVPCLHRVRRARGGRARAPAGERGWTVVSGGAFGIDGAAHRGALAAEAATLAVLACGVDRPYPAAHGALFHRIAETGLLVSEWPPGCAPLRHRFLVRNRLIAALTRGTVVVEAAARSGAQATARRAQGLGRQVLVVPGPVTSAMSVGCHELLRDEDLRAVLVTSAAQVIEAVGRIGDDLAPPVSGPSSPRDGLSDLAARVLDACPVRTGVSPERLAAIAGCDALEVLRVLPALELADLVEWTGTGWRLAAPPGRWGGPGAAA
ncbi:DNA-processing protein DprA [Blastococcus brunescens]|uniref:DNA-processing protein DprA n=1 Tax=Blastococcus brunescens TaxID=1564165 RepID=UPI003BEECC9D